MLLAFLHLGSPPWRNIPDDLGGCGFWQQTNPTMDRKRKGGTYEYDWLPMTQELRKSLMWWWEYRPVKDQAHVFLCLDEKKAMPESIRQTV
jgi:hypothetical protein